MITQKLSTFNINKLTQNQYNTALENGLLKDNELYLVPHMVNEEENVIIPHLEILSGAILKSGPSYTVLPETADYEYVLIDALKGNTYGEDSEKNYAYEIEKLGNDFILKIIDCLLEKDIDTIDYPFEMKIGIPDRVKLEDTTITVHCDYIISCLVEKNELQQNSLTIRCLKDPNNSKLYIGTVYQDNPQHNDITITDTPEKDNNNAISSNGVYNALQELEEKIPDTSSLQEKNLTTSISVDSTDEEYPSAKVVYNNLISIEEKIPDTSTLQEKNLVTTISNTSTDETYPSAKSVYDAINAIKIPDTKNLQEKKLVTAISAESTDETYPSAKAVYTAIDNIEIPNIENLQEKKLITSISDTSTDEQYPSARAVYLELQDKQDNLTIETTPIADNQNPISAGGVWTAVEDVRAVAFGKCQTYIRDDKTDLENWLTNEMDTTLLHKGDVFLLRDVGVPDYWWEPVNEIALFLEDDATSISEYSENDIIIETEEGVRKGVARVLETTKVPLNDYLLISNAKTKLSEMEQDDSYQTVTKAQKEAWTNKSDFDGQYNSLDGKPTLHACATSGQAESISITKADGTIASYKIRIASEGDSGVNGYITLIV